METKEVNKIIIRIMEIFNRTKFQLENQNVSEHIVLGMIYIVN
jgi:hypothetical protein